MQSKVILVTGATGFVGKNFIKYLLKKEQGVKIITLNRNLEKAEKIFREDNVINLDLNEEGVYRKINKMKPNIIIHLASYLTSLRSKEVLEELIKVNIEFPTKLLNIFEANQIEYFFNFGTFAEYVKGTEKIENAYLYSATKSAFKSILDFYSNILNFKYFNLIPYSIYGRQDNQKKVIDYIIDSIFSSSKIDMSLGEQVLDFIHIDDICEYIYKILKNRDKIPNKENLFLGTGKGTSIRELSLIIEKIYKKNVNINWGGKPYRENDIFYAVAPIQKNKLYLNWNPEISLEKGIKIYYEESK